MSLHLHHFHFRSLLRNSVNKHAHDHSLLLATYVFLFFFIACEPPCEDVANHLLNTLWALRIGGPPLRCRFGQSGSRVSSNTNIFCRHCLQFFGKTESCVFCDLLCWCATWNLWHGAWMVEIWWRSNLLLGFSMVRAVVSWGCLCDRGVFLITNLVLFAFELWWG